MLRPKFFGFSSRDDTVRVQDSSVVAEPNASIRHRVVERHLWFSVHDLGHRLPRQAFGYLLPQFCGGLFALAHDFLPHRALAARRADAFRCAGLSRAFSVAAPFRPPLRPMAAMTCEMVARSGSAGTARGFQGGGSPFASGSLLGVKGIISSFSGILMLRRTTSAANWLMS